MFCEKCGASLPEGAAFCNQCGAAANAREENAQSASAQENASVPPKAEMRDDENIVARVKDHAKLCGILWIVVGALQCLSCVGLIAGVWNIIIGARELKLSETIAAGNREVYNFFDNNLTMIIVGGVINLVFGFVVGCALTAFDVYIRDQVLKNKRLFGA